MTLICFNHSAIRGEHPGVYIIVYTCTLCMNTMCTSKMMNYEL